MGRRRDQSTPWGAGVTLFKPGDEVYYAGSITRPGCNSEYHWSTSASSGRKPRNLSFEEAAAMPLTTITAWEAMFDRMAIPSWFWSHLIPAKPFMIPSRRWRPPSGGLRATAS